MEISGKEGGFWKNPGAQSGLNTQLLSRELDAGIAAAGHQQRGVERAGAPDECFPRTGERSLALRFPRTDETSPALQTVSISKKSSTIIKQLGCNCRRGVVG